MWSISRKIYHETLTTQSYWTRKAAGKIYRHSINGSHISYPRLIGEIVAVRKIWNSKTVEKVFIHPIVDSLPQENMTFSNTLNYTTPKKVTFDCSKNKKVLLRERKRHTARCLAVASACYSGGGTMGTPPTWTWDGVPPSPLPGPGMGYPPTQTWDGVPPLPGPGMGYPPYLDLRWGTPPTQTWDGIPPLPRPEMGYPPPRKCEQTENITFPHPSDGGR